MFCPTCGRELQKISVNTNSGGRFEVDHCGYCGGTWFDPYEINRIPYHEVANLANVTVLPMKNIRKLPNRLCPNDHNALEIFKGDAVPKNVHLLWCRKCLGLWATGKDLIDFKKHQEETISAYDLGDKFFPKLSVAFIPALTFLFLILTTFSTIFSLQNANEGRTYAESQIKNLTSTPVAKDALVITFETHSEVKSAISYGLTKNDLSEKDKSEKPSASHSFILKNLIPGTPYYYKITLIDGHGRSFTTELNSFVIR